MVSSRTLLIRHMPSQLSSEEKESFCRHFGAIGVKTFDSKHKKSSNVFALFETNKAAEAALRRLHQTEILGQLLSVEFAREDESTINFNIASRQDKMIVSDEAKEKTQKYYENFLYRLSSWAVELNLNIPPPVHLKYQYPPPSKKVLENIAQALATVPKFYTQVLHLMNKMNLPCPFVEPFPIKTDLFDSKIDLELYNEINDEHHNKLELSTEDESEIESEEDEKIKLPIIPSKRNLPEKKRIKKRPKFIKPIAMTNRSGSKTLLKTDEVFEVSEKDPTLKKIEVKITPDLSSIHEAEETQKGVTPVEGFEKLPACEISSTILEEKKTSDTEDENIVTCITEQELSANRISSRDQRILPVFKNYQPGVPSCRLYIKNLAKQVQSKDLHYIFRRFYVPEEIEQGTMFDIRLMQEGRMKGQAFINLQSVELAQKALKETNGFILKDKPMVVQFARSSKAK